MKSLLVLTLSIVIFGCSIIHDNSQTSIKNTHDTLNSVNSKFGQPITEFELKVPLNYNHFTQVDSFVEANYKTWDISWQLCDSNVRNATNKLVPGQSYTVKIIHILKKVTAEECIEFLRNQHAIFVNVQGLTLAWTLDSIKFPTDCYVLSFDEKESLLKTKDVKYTEYMVPMIGHSTSFGYRQLYIFPSYAGWDEKFFIIAFFEKPETTR